MRSSTAETRYLDHDVSVETSRPRFLERIGFPSGFAPAREGALVVVIVAPLVTWIYRLRDANWKVPWSYSGDGMGGAAYAESMIENGWYFHTSRLGAPFQADWRDFPLGGENAHWLALKAIGTVTGNYALAVNGYFIVTFFLIALVTYFVARYLAFGVATSLVVSVAYAFLPYHAARNESHLARSGYYAVPLALLVLLWVADYRKEFLAGTDHKAWRRWRLAIALVIGVIMGMSDTQNAAFMMSILAVLAVVGAARDRDWRPLVLLALMGVATFGSLAVNNAPFVIARVERGKNTAAANRSLQEQDVYGLRAVELVLPASGHRIKMLRSFTQKADQGRILNGEAAGTPLGTFGTIGFVWSLGAVLALGLGYRHRSAASRFVAQLGAMNVIAILVGITGGFAYLIAVAGFDQYRTWNRISLFIALGSVLATGVLLEWLFRFVRQRLASKHVLMLGVTSLIVLVLCVGVAFDQVTPQFIFPYERTTARFNIDDDFYRQVEASVPKGVMMFQLPFQPYPENGPTANMADYEDFTGFLHTKNLRWNYGGIKGRPEGDWQQKLSINEPVGTLAQIASVGFQGVVVDRTGFTDNASSFLSKAVPVVGEPKVRSRDGRLLYFDLTGLRSRLDREVGPAGVDLSKQIVLDEQIDWTGFSFPEPAECGGQMRWAVTPTASIEFDNTTGAPLTTPVSTSFVANPLATTIQVRGPDFTEEVRLGGGNAAWERRVTLPPGKSKLQFTLVGPRVVAKGDRRPLQFALRHYSFGPQFDSPALAWAKDVVHEPCPAG